jgi:hypothetical protein
MKEFNSYLILFGMMIGLIAVLYFLWFKPALKDEYEKGLAQCEADTDTLYLPGEDSVAYRDTSFFNYELVQVKDTDSLLMLESSFDTSFVSGKDTITNKSNVVINVKKNLDGWNIKNLAAKWLSAFTHKDFTPLPDTIKTYYPKYITTLKEVINWTYVTIAFVAGVFLSVIIFLTAK